MNNFRYIYAFIFFMLSHSAMAGIVLGGTRIVYPAKQPEVQIALKNKDTDKRYLVQSWVSNLDDSKAPFVITPPIYKIDENRQTLLHIVYTGHENALPQDRESIFMTNVKSVSAIPENMRDKNMLQFAIKTKLKLFYRPAGLSDSDARDAWKSLEFKRTGNRMAVKNPSPFFITFGQLTVGGRDAKPVGNSNMPSALSMMLAPFSEQSFEIPAGAKGDVAWSAMNDFGSETEVQKRPL